MLINHSKKILQILIFTFPLFMVVGSAIVNLSTMIISIIVLFFYYKEARAELFKNKIIIYSYVNGAIDNIKNYSNMVCRVLISHALH